MTDQITTGEISKDLETHAPDGPIDTPAAGKKLNLDASKLRDKHGNAFDPELHETDSAGRPVVNPSGTLRRKSGPGRPKSFVGARRPQQRQSAVDPGGGSGSGSGSEQPAELAELDHSAAARREAKMMALWLSTFGKIPCGPEFMPASEPESTAQVEACLEQYFIEAGTLKLPAWVGLVLGLTGVIGQQIMKPEVKQHLAAFIGSKKPAKEAEVITPPAPAGLAALVGGR